MRNGVYTNIEMEVLENPGYETEGTDGKRAINIFKNNIMKQNIGNNMLQVGLQYNN